MLLLKTRQLDDLRVGMQQRFEAGLLAHIERYFRNHWRVLGREALQAVVGLGVDRARAHRLHSERDVYLYVSVMLYLGSHFDADTQLPWAQQLLARDDAAGQPSRAEQVYDAAREFMRRAYGRRNEHLDAALKQIATVLDSPLASIRIGCEAELQYALRWVFRAKYEIVGEAALARLVRQCIEMTRRRGIATQRGAALCTGLMFMLGQGFDRDPQHAWAAAALDDTAGDADARVDRLFNAARVQFARWTA